MLLSACSSARDGPPRRTASVSGLDDRPCGPPPVALREAVRDRPACARATSNRSAMIGRRCWSPGRSRAGPGRATSAGAPPRAPSRAPPRAPRASGPRPSASSSSSLRIVSGVRSSWLAPATNARSRSTTVFEPREHLVERLAEPLELVARGGHGQARARARSRDPSARRRMLSTGASALRRRT